jgi:hypothetical protein
MKYDFDIFNVTPLTEKENLFLDELAKYAMNKKRDFEATLSHHNRSNIVKIFNNTVNYKFKDDEIRSSDLFYFYDTFKQEHKSFIDSIVKQTGYFELKQLRDTNRGVSVLTMCVNLRDFLKKERSFTDKRVYQILRSIIEFYFKQGLEKWSEAAVGDIPVFSISELEAIKSYFMYRRMKPNTAKHFADIIHNL